MTIAPTLTGTPGAAPASAAAETRSRVLRMPRFPKIIVGLVILALFALMAIVGPIIAPYSPDYYSLTFVHLVQVPGVPGQYYPLPFSPSSTHWLGTTLYAQDVWSQLLWSARATLLVGFLAGLMATAMSVLVGVSAGYLGGYSDEGLSLFSNVFLAIPGLPLLIVLASYVPSADTDPVLIALIVAVTGWAYGARVMRAQTLSLRNRDFVEAARVAGESRLRIILAEVLPNLVPIVAASFLFTTLYAIGAYVSLSFLGLAGTTVWNWGTMLFHAQAESAVISGWWWWWAPPGICIALVGTSLALVNFGIDEFINPRLRASGVSAKAARKAGVGGRPKFGYTPVMRKSAPAPAAAEGGGQ